MGYAKFSQTIHFPHQNEFQKIFLGFTHLFVFYALKVVDEAEKVDLEVEENCVGIGEEECLMRRTLAAHTDYIYTQKQSP